MKINQKLEIFEISDSFSSFLRRFYHNFNILDFQFLKHENKHRRVTLFFIYFRCACTLLLEEGGRTGNNDANEVFEGCCLLGV